MGWDAQGVETLDVGVVRFGPLRHRDACPSVGEHVVPGGAWRTGAVDEPLRAEGGDEQVLGKGEEDSERPHRRSTGGLADVRFH